MASKSDFKVEQCAVEWTVDVPSGREFRDSPRFTFQASECYFRLYSRTLLLNSEPELSSPVHVTCRILNGPDTIYHVRGPVTDHQLSRVWVRVAEFTSRPVLCFKITLHCASKSSHGQVNAEDKLVQTPSSLLAISSLESLSADLQKLMDEGSQHDLELRCADQVIPAHSLILSARSEVFAAMVKTNMREKRSGSVEIVDMEFPVLEQFLRYLYAGTLPELSVELASRLYEAGDKYAVGDLKERCSDFLVENLTVPNACGLLLLADAHHDQKFRESVITYIVDQEVPKKDNGWCMFSSNNPILGLEILNRFVFRS